MDFTEKKPDRRVLRTKKAIRNAFAQLLMEKDIDLITATDIADRADINRKTFYNYYAGVYQLIDEIENELIETLEERLRDTDFKMALQHPELIYSNFTAHIEDYNVARFLLEIKWNANLVNKLVVTLKTKVAEALNTQMDISPLDLDVLTTYVISGLIAVYQSWLHSDRSVSLEEISQQVGLLVVDGMNGILGRAQGNFCGRE